MPEPRLLNLPPPTPLKRTGPPGMRRAGRPYFDSTPANSCTLSAPIRSTSSLTARMSSTLMPPVDVDLGAGAGVVRAAGAAGAAVRAGFLPLGLVVLVRTF